MISRLGQSRALPLVVLVAGLAAQALYAAHLASGFWFFGDDWDFLLNRSVTDVSLWAPHNEHWSTVPIAIFRLVFAGFGLGSYLPYALLPIAMHVAIWLLVYALLRRLEVDPWPAAVSAWLGAFLAGGVGAENTLWDFQVGFLGSAAFGLAALWFLGRNTTGHLVAGWIALVLSLASSGVGIVFVGWACLETLLRQGWPRGVYRAFAVASVPGAAYVLWYLLIGYLGHSSLPTDRAVAPLFAAGGLDAIWSKAFASPGAGAVVLALLVWIVFFQPQPTRAFALGASGLVALLVAFALFGLARSGLGEGAVAASRYLYHGFVFCAPAVGLLVQRAARHLPEDPLVRFGVLGSALAGTAALGLAHLNQFSDDWTHNTDGLKERLAATALLIDRGELFAYDRPSSQFNPNITVDLLRPVRGEVRGDVSPEALMETRGVVQVVVRPEAPSHFGPARSIEWDGFEPPVAAAEPSAKCVTRTVEGDTGMLKVAVPRAGVGLRLETEDNTEIRTSVTDGEHESDGRDWDVDEHGFVLVESSAAGHELLIEVPDGDVTVCAVRPKRR